MPRINGYHAASALLVLITFAIATWNLNHTIPWWDEGWTMTVARTWVEQGDYAVLRNGEPVAGTLATGFPTVASVALSFKVFGVGIWQARIPGLISTMVSLALLAFLAQQLYNARIALVTLVIVLLLPTHPSLHPLINGRQVLAEMVMICFVLAGYASFLLTMRRSYWFALLAVVCWGTALVSKLQTLPFWAVSLLLPMLVALVRQRWKLATTLALMLVGSYGVSRLWYWFTGLILAGNVSPGTPIEGIYQVTALVPQASVRESTLIALLWLGLPALLGPVYTAWCWLRDSAERTLETDGSVLRLMLLALTGSWLVWYLLLSIGWLRYLFPAVFIGSIFSAALLDAATNQFRPLSLLTRLHTMIAQRCLEWRTPAALLVILLFIAMLPFSHATLRQLPIQGRGKTALIQLAEYINAQPRDTLVETYDTEIFFVLDRPYHFPPDQLHVELNRRTFLDQDVPIDYDPLSSDPEYLVIGPNSRMWKLYDPLLETEAFNLVQQYGPYDVYQRERGARGR